MKIEFNDKTIHSLFIVGVVVAVLVFLMYFKIKLSAAPKSGTSPSSALTPAQFLAATQGPAGTTNAGVLNGSSDGSPNLAFDTYNYKVPVPSFHYSGNESIYMPMFGFVGYSSSGTM